MRSTAIGFSLLFSVRVIFFVQRNHSGWILMLLAIPMLLLGVEKKIRKPSGDLVKPDPPSSKAVDVQGKNTYEESENKNHTLRIGMD